ncbi:MAG: IPT/TIG domain-containing protein [Bradymonadia bacterium]
MLMALFTVSTGCDEPRRQSAERPISDSGIEPDLGAPVIVDRGVLTPDAEVLTRLNSIFPNRASVDGNVSVRLVGDEFVDGTSVRLGEAGCQQVEVLSTNHLRCIVPAAEMPGRVDVTVTWPDGTEETLVDGFSYFVPLEAETLTPPASPVSGGIMVTLRGRGFIEGTEVFFGDQRVRVDSVDESGTTALVRCPEGEPGTVDVTVRNLNGTATIADGFSWYEDLVLETVEPPFGRVAGGDIVRLVGIGLTAQSRVLFDGVEAEIVEAGLGRRSLQVRTPAREIAGNVDLSIENANGMLTLSNGFLYVDSEDGPFGVTGMAPRRLDRIGGETFYVAGRGFSGDTSVEIDGDELTCVATSANLLECVTQAHVQGPATVTVRDGGARSEWPDAVTFFKRVEIYDVSPPRGGIAGGTLVDIIGTGFDDETRFVFEDRELVVEERLSDQHIIARTPRHRAGWISLTAESAFATAVLPSAFEYFDPTSQFGGLWGEPLEGSLNITVVDGMTGQSLPEAKVVVMNVGQPGRWTGTTNDEGQVTISDEDLRLPASATASLEGYTTTTFERLTVENATLVLVTQTPPMGSGDMDPVEPVQLSGRVQGLDRLQKPSNEGFSLVCFIETSHSSPGNRLGAPAPLPNGLLVEDGPFEIFVGAGEFAVVAMAGYIPAVMKLGYEEGQVPYWTFRDALQPIQMGVRRFVTASPGDVIDGLNIELDIPMDQRAEVRLGNPSGGVRGAPDLYRAHAILDLGADGYFDLRYPLSGEQVVFEVGALPDLDAIPGLDVSFRWEGEAEQSNPEQLYRYAWAMTEQRELNRPVVIGPFVGNTEILEPRHEGQMNPFRWVEWVTLAGVEGAMSPTEPADIHLSRVSSGQTVLWTYWVPGAANRFQFPQLDLDSAGQDLPDGRLQLNLYSLLIDGPFEFDNFTFNDLNRLRAYSYSYVLFNNQ